MRLAAITAVFCLSTFTWAQAPDVYHVWKFVDRVNVPKGSVAFAVEKPRGSGVYLPESYNPTSLEELAAKVDYKVKTFGNLVVLAPQTKTRLLAPDRNTDPYIHLSDAKAFRYLVALLDDAQLKLLKGAQGIGESDLKDDAQRWLLRRILAPSGTFTYSSSNWRESNHVDATNLIPRMRIRLGTTGRIYFPSPPSSFYSELPPGKYSSSSGVNEGLGATAVVQNDPFDGNLPVKNEALKKPFNIKACVTVKELVGAASEATGVKIFADPRIGGLRLGMSVESEEVTALNALRGVALALGCTYRKVADSFVLTDELEGLGSRRMAWLRFDAKTNEEVSEVLENKKELINSRLALGANREFGESLVPTDSQKKLDPDYRPDGFLNIAKVKYGALTTAQKKEVDRIVSEMRKTKDYTSEVTYPDSADSIVGVATIINLEALVPGLDAPVYLNCGELHEQPNYVPPVAPTEVAVTSSDKDLAEWRKASSKFGEVAFALDLSLAAEAPGALAKMKALGAASVWFRVPITELASWSSETNEGLKDFKSLAEKANQLGLKVCVVTDPLSTKEPRKEDCDVDILGRIANLGTYDKGQPAAETWLNPSSANVSQMLDKVAVALGKCKEVSGLCLRRTVGPGYLLNLRFGGDASGADLGYSLESRYSFLKKYSVDPIDLTPAGVMNFASMTRLPYFESRYWEFESAALRSWNQFLTETNEACLRKFAASVTNAGFTGPIFVQNRRDPMGRYWYGLWDAPSGRLPGALGEVDAETVSSFSAGIDWARTYSKKVVTTFGYGRVSLKTVTAYLNSVRAGFPADAVTIFLTLIPKPEVLLEKWCPAPRHPAQNSRPATRYESATVPLRNNLKQTGRNTWCCVKVGDSCGSTLKNHAHLAVMTNRATDLWQKQGTTEATPLTQSHGSQESGGATLR